MESRVMVTQWLGCDTDGSRLMAVRVIEPFMDDDETVYDISSEAEDWHGAAMARMCDDLGWDRLQARVPVVDGYVFFTFSAMEQG